MFQRPVLASRFRGCALRKIGRLGAASCETLWGNRVALSPQTNNWEPYVSSLIPRNYTQASRLRLERLF